MRLPELQFLYLQISSPNNMEGIVIKGVNKILHTREYE